jgi:hypothetical protein
MWRSREEQWVLVGKGPGIAEIYEPDHGRLPRFHAQWPRAPRCWCGLENEHEGRHRAES